MANQQVIIVDGDILYRVAKINGDTVHAFGANRMFEFKVSDGIILPLKVGEVTNVFMKDKKCHITMDDKDYKVAPERYPYLLKKFKLGALRPKYYVLNNEVRFYSY